MAFLYQKIFCLQSLDIMLSQKFSCVPALTRRCLTNSINNTKNSLVTKLCLQIFLLINYDRTTSINTQEISNSTLTLLLAFRKLDYWPITHFRICRYIRDKLWVTNNWSK